MYKNGFCIFLYMFYTDSYIDFRSVIYYNKGTKIVAARTGLKAGNIHMRSICETITRLNPYLETLNLY